LFLVSFFSLAAGYRYCLDKGIYDEGLAVYGAVRILKGEMPYRDFWTLYAPGEFYLLAGIFKLLGTSIKTVRILQILIHALLSILVYLFMRQLNAAGFSLLGYFVSLLWLRRMLFYGPSYSYNAPTAMVFVLLAAYCIIYFIRQGRKRWLFIAGLSSALTCLFRQDFGLYVFVPILSIVLFFSFSVSPGKPQREKVLSSIRNGSAYIVGLSLGVLPIIFYFASKAAIRSLFADAVLFPLNTYSRVRNLPFPNLSLGNLIFYFPLLIFLLTFILVLGKWARGDLFRQENSWVILLSLFLGIALFAYPCIRPQIRYLLPTMLPAIILFTYLSFLCLRKNTWRTRPLSRLSVMVVVLVTILFLFVRPLFQEAEGNLFLPAGAATYKIALRPARGIYDWHESTGYQLEAVRYIQEHTRPDEKIFVGNLRHDRIWVNDILFYFLSERQSATMYHELHAGLVTTPQVQKKIIEEIEKNKVRYVVLWGGHQKQEPNESSMSSGVRDLDEFIRRNYIPVQSFGHYQVLLRRR
jgi:hypothetical protein